MSIYFPRLARCQQKNEPNCNYLIFKIIYFEQNTEMEHNTENIQTVPLLGKCPCSEFFWSLQSRIRTESIELSLLIQSKCGKIRTRKTPNTDTFHAVYLIFFMEIAVMRVIFCTENNFCIISHIKTLFINSATIINEKKKFSKTQ